MAKIIEGQHTAVVVVNDGALAFGFPHIYSAVAFIERQLPKDSAKTFGIVAEALNGPVDIEADKYQILSADDYLDVYGDDVEDEDEDDTEE